MRRRMQRATHHISASTLCQAAVHRHKCYDLFDRSARYWSGACSHSRGAQIKLPVDKEHSSVEPGMISIPGGWFTMGCETGRDDEKPVHRVWVDAFEIAAHQLTNDEYAPFLAGTKRAEPEHWNDAAFNSPRQPVVGVSWYDANTYRAWLSLLTGHHYRLPTEAEWEFAARGGKEGALYPWGDAAPEEIPNYSSRWKNAPEEVGLYAPNPFGIY